MQFIGQENNIELINNWQEMPPFTIIQGDSHMGKTYLTLYLCNKFNLHYVSINKSVKEIRSLINIMSPNSNSLYHLKDFHTASIEAKNALLKITEEPIPGNYIVITGGPQIKTLHSRARNILMSPYSKECLREYMSPLYSELAIQDALIESGLNSPAKIKYYSKYEKITNLSNFAHDLVNEITCLSPENIISLMQNFENRYDNDIDAYLLFITMLINLIEHKITDKRRYPYREILEILIRGKNGLIRQPTLKRKMLIFQMFYEIMKVTLKENK